MCHFAFELHIHQYNLIKFFPKLKRRKISCSDKFYPSLPQSYNCSLWSKNNVKLKICDYFEILSKVL